jgi:hypothetical protein
LEDRLELHGTNAKTGERVRVPDDCDGIACRDETIRLLDKRIEELELVVQNYRLGGRWKGSEIDDIIADNERLRALLDEALSVTDGLDDDSYLEPEHRACMISWRDAIKAALAAAKGDEQEHSES